MKYEPDLFDPRAVYGSPKAQEVATLRRFRDGTLLTRSPGRVLVAIYYALSPALARMAVKHEN